MTNAAAEPRAFLAAGWSVRWKRAWLLAFGAAFAFYEASHLNKVLPPGWSMEGSRSDWADHGIAGLNHHTPLLVGWYGGTREAIGVADDLGWYVYSALLGHWFHVGNSLEIARWCYIVLFSLLIFIAPLVWFELFGSILVGIVVPLALHREFHFMQNSDTYWINGWAILLLLPIVALIWQRRWTRWSIAALAAVMLAASWVSSVRTQGGLPILIAALGVVAVKQRGLLPRFAVAALLAAVYVSIFPLGFIPIEHTRDAAVHEKLTALYPTQHAPWHNMYIGLGYIRNPYGIAWLDEVGFIKAQQLDPGVIPNSKRYVRDMRTLYLRMLEHHPGFVFRGYEAKSKVVAIDSYNQWKKLLVLLPLMLAFGSRRRISRALALFGVPAVVLNFLPPVLTVPYSQYMVGFKTTVGFYWLVALAWLVATLAVDVPGLVASKRLPDLSALRGRRLDIRSRRALACGVAVLAVLLLALYKPPLGAGQARLPSQNAAPWGAAAQLFAPDAIRGTRVASWTLSRPLSSGWAPVSGTRLTGAPGGGSGVTVSTPSGASSYAITGPVVHLRPGSYKLVVTGSVIDGGIELGALDVSKNRWLATAHYWSGQHFDGQVMVAGFRVDSTERVQPVLSNWHNGTGSSTWIASAVSIVSERR